MVENCYILYSCGENQEPIVSNYSGLSAYTSSYVTVSGDCYYVLDVGIIDCNPTQVITSVSGGTCDCPCYCYFIKSATETADVTYVNCNDEIVVETLNEGLTYNICSKVYPQFDTTTQIPLKLTDICQDGKCPPTIPSVKPTNECDVITIFPMKVTCSIQNPTNDKTFDGATELIITGGTPPYTIFWEVGSFAPALTNLSVGDYTATVTDYYGDFTVTTTCVLTADTVNYSGMCFVLTGIVEDQLVYVSTDSLGLKNGKPYYQIQYGVNFYGYVFWSQQNNQWTLCQTLDCQTNDYSYLSNTSLYPSGTTGSWSSNTTSQTIIYESYVGRCSVPVPTLEPTSLCLTITEEPSKYSAPVITQVQLDESIYVNGMPSWTSTTQYGIYWNTNSTPSQWTLTGYSNPNVTITNNDPTYPPTSNWTVFGTPVITNIQLVPGPCSSSYSISVNAIPNDADCDSSGSITVQAGGGVTPYQYSIDGGITYQSSPIFLNLVAGTYNIFVQDSNNVIGSVTNIIVGTISPVVYTVNLSVNYATNTFTLTAPTMAFGAFIEVQLSMLSTFSYYPTSLSPLPTYNNIVTVNGLGQVPVFVAPTVNTYQLGGPCTPTPTVTQIQNQYLMTIQLTSNQVYTGFITNSITNNPTGNCQNATGYYQLVIQNPRCLGFECCSGNVINTVPPTPLAVL